ncbi:hypothetical protein [Polaromonas sp. CG9_12]|nr:hypothetical protein [Polaromonas sp. CG9_12]
MQDTEYEDEWAADKEATDAQDAADKGVAASKMADDDFEFAEPGTLDTASAARIDAAPAPAAAPAKTFKQAFKAARDAGAKDFEWKRPDGTPYRVTTQIKGEVAKNATSPRMHSSPAAAKPAPRALPRQAPARATEGKVPYTPSAPGKATTPEVVMSTPVAARTSPARGRASPAPMSKAVPLRMPDVEDDGFGPVEFNQPGGTLLSKGKARGQSAILSDDRLADAPTPRRGYKS